MKKLFVFIISIVLAWGCNDELAPDSGGNSITLERTSDVKMSIEMNVEVSQFLTCVNPEDRDEMTQAEKILAVPKPKRFNAIYYLKEDGLIDANLEYYTSPDMIDFPENTIGLHQVSEKFRAKRIEIRDGIMTRFNENGEEINEDYVNHDISGIIEDLVSGVSQNAAISDQNFDAVLQAFDANGFALSHSNTESAVLTHTFPDNGRVTMLVDKQARKVVARSNFDPNGDLISNSSMIYHDNPDELSAYVFSTYYESPFSENKMAYNYFVKVFDQEIKTY